MRKGFRSHVNFVYALTTPTFRPAVISSTKKLYPNQAGTSHTFARLYAIGHYTENQKIIRYSKPYSMFRRSGA